MNRRAKAKPRKPAPETKVFYACGTDWHWEPDVRLYRTLAQFRAHGCPSDECGIVRVTVVGERVVNRRAKGRAKPRKPVCPPSLDVLARQPRRRRSPKRNKPKGGSSP